MGMAKPEADILQHCDDINSAFWRILYHPDLALIFAYVVPGPFVIVHVGMVLERGMMPLPTSA
jgi:hydrogenase maturation factor